MSYLENKFKELLQDDLNQRFLEAQMNLNIPPNPDMACSIHEIGTLRGYMKAMKEAYEACDEIMKKLTEPEEGKKDAVITQGI